MKKNKIFQNTGFSLIELLVVIAIIGILAAVILVNLNGSRRASRDAKRVADVRQISTALSLYFQDNAGYPTPDIASTTGPDPASGDPEFSTYLQSWPEAPVPADNPGGVLVCTSPGPGQGTNQYTYTQLNSGADYNVTFCLGAQVGNYTAGLHTLDSTGVH